MVIWLGKETVLSGFVRKWTKSTATSSFEMGREWSAHDQWKGVIFVSLCLYLGAE